MAKNKMVKSYSTSPSDKKLCNILMKGLCSDDYVDEAIDRIRRAYRETGYKPYNTLLGKCPKCGQGIIFEGL